MILALLVAFIVSLLGLSFLMMSETERRIARNERFSTLALYGAESGARLVKRWFDRPEGFIKFPAVGVTDRKPRKPGEFADQSRFSFYDRPDPILPPKDGRP